MAVTYKDLIEGDAAAYTRRGWETVTRVAVVDEITPTLNGHAKILAAFTQLGVDIGFQHPSFTANYITSINPSSISSEAVSFIVTYEQMEGFADELSGGGSLIQVETNLDRNGNVIELSYTFSEDYDIDAKYAGQTDIISKLVQIDDNVAPFSIKRREIFTTIEKPQDLSETYVGRLNSSNWKPVFDGAPRKWKCVGIDYNYIIPVFKDSQKRYAYDMLYQFQYNKEGWDTTLVYTDPNTGNPPTNATPQTFEILKEANFNNLIDSIIT